MKTEEAMAKKKAPYDDLYGRHIRKLLERKREARLRAEIISCQEKVP